MKYIIYKVYIARRFKEISEKKEKKRKEEEKASRHPQYLKTHALLLELRLFSSRQIFTRKKKKKKEYPKFRIDSNLKARQTLTYP